MIAAALQAGLLVTDYGGDLLTNATATFNQARTHRYLLTRKWGSEPPMVWVMLNPSTADAMIVDPTVARCISRARRDGCGGAVVMNLFALCSTDPRALTGHPDPVGEYNDAFLRCAAAYGGPVVAAWGACGTLTGRANAVGRMLQANGDDNLLCLGVTSGGYPRHPLYVRNDAPLRLWKSPA